jgi:hypothetical protein
MEYKIRTGEQLDAVLAKMSGMTCLTGIKLPTWLHSWTADWPNRLDTPAQKTVSYLPEHYLNVLEQAAYIDGMHTGRISKADLVITQAPFIISDFPLDMVLVFEPKGRGDWVVTSPEFQTFGASANKITMCLLGRRDTIGDYARRKLNGLVKRLDAGEDPTRLITEVEHAMGESVEKCIFVNNCIDKEDELAKHTGNSKRK